MEEEPQKTVKLDMHVHTCHSKDSTIKPSSIGRILEEKNLDGAAITDHNVLTGYCEAAKHTGKLIVPGVEVHTSRGDIVALFIQDEVGSRDFFTVVDEVHSQGGLVVLAHPFDWLRRSSPKMGSFSDRDLTELVDAIEVLNSRCVFTASNERARNLAHKLGKPMLAGSDAHTPMEVGRSYIVIREAQSVEDVYQAIKSGKATPQGAKSSFLVHFSTLIRFFK